MFSKVVVCVLVFACLAELTIACASTAGSAAGTTAAAATTKSGSRKRRSADVANVELVSNVPASNSGLLLHKLQSAAATSDLDASKYGDVEHQLTTGSDGNSRVVLRVSNVQDCADLKQNIQKIKQKVPEVIFTEKLTWLT